MSMYYAPAFQIEVDGSRLKADISKNIQQVHIVSKPDTLDSFSFILTNALPTMRWTHTDDSQLFKPGSSVKIAMGYVDDMYDMMEGEVTQISPTFPATGVPTVGIEGNSLMHRLSGASNTRTFQDTTPKEIAEQIGAEAGLEVNADDVEMQQSYVIQPNKSDLQFLKDMARSINFEVLVRGKTLLFRKIVNPDTPAMTLIWYGTQESFAPAPDTLPLKSFSPTMDALAPVTNVQYRSYDVQSKKAFVSNASASDNSSPMCGMQAASDLPQTAFGRPRNIVHVTSPFASQQEGDQRASSTYGSKAQNCIGGTAETIGIPQLGSGQRVQLKGLGPTFNGLYCIDQATHTIDANGYSTSLQLKRNAT